MAKIKSLIKIEGTLDELTFYKTADGNFVRMKGGVSKERILKDPSFIRTRENMEEFGHVARTGKNFRLALGSVLKQAKDNKLTGRMTKVLSQIKKLDTQSLRGKRQISQGILGLAGKQLLVNFDFNRHATLQHVLIKPILVDETTATVSIANLIPLDDLRVPEGATHVYFSGAHLNYDFAANIADLQEFNTVVTTIDMQSSNITLQPSQLASGNGTSFIMISISFYQEVNGQHYSLRNGLFNILNSRSL
jgi:hypothetical protein